MPGYTTIIKVAIYGGRRMNVGKEGPGKY